MTGVSDERISSPGSHRRMVYQERYQMLTEAFTELIFGDVSNIIAGFQLLFQVNSVTVRFARHNIVAKSAGNYRMSRNTLAFVNMAIINY